MIVGFSNKAQAAVAKSDPSRLKCHDPRIVLIISNCFCLPRASKHLIVVKRLCRSYRAQVIRIWNAMVPKLA